MAGEAAGFWNWTAASIAKMPETHISQWAEQNGVAMDKQYATELREGGFGPWGAACLGSGMIC